MIALKLLTGMLLVSVFSALLLRFAGVGWRIPKAVTIVSVVILVSGMLLALLQEEDLSYYQTLRSWPRTTATVIETDIVGERAVLPEIRYRYQVGGETYTDSTNLNIPGFGNRKKRQQTARIIISDYPAGKELTIAYNPEKPKISRFQLTPPWNLYGQFGFGIVLFGTGIFLLTLSLVSSRKHN